MNLNEYLINTHEHLGGMREVYKFPNGYGASVVVGGLVTSHRGEWNIELAVLYFDEEGSYNLTYDTPITSDVEIFKDEQSLEETLVAISKL